jgi:hypothetical protein
MRTQKAFYEPITQELRRNQYDSVIVRLEEAREANKYGEKDRLVYFLDAGFARYYAGQYAASTEKLNMADQAGEELYTRSISRAALSLLLNDNALEYAGEDYELLYANLFKALDFIAIDSFDAAFVEIRRANQKLDLLEQKYADAAQKLNEGQAKDSNSYKVNYEAKRIRFNNSAFGRYLSMHVYAADGKFDDARIDYDALQEAFVSQPHIYSFAPPDVSYASDSGSILSVVAMAGLAPVKEPINLRLRTDKQLNLVQILYTEPTGEETQFGQLPMPISEDFYFKFAIPTLVAQPSAVTRIEVSANGKPIGSLGLLEDVGSVARETFEAKKSLIYLRTIARALAKGLSTYKLKKNVDSGGLGGWLKKAAIDVGTDLTENADLRCARLLPGKIYVGDFSLPPGKYDLSIAFYDATNSLVRRAEIPGYVVLEKGLNMIQASALQ